jgi:hypothetical protein
VSQYRIEGDAAVEADVEAAFDCTSWKNQVSDLNSSKSCAQLINASREVHLATKNFLMRPSLNGLATRKVDKSISNTTRKIRFLTSFLGSK